MLPIMPVEGPLLNILDPPDHSLRACHLPRSGSNTPSQASSQEALNLLPKDGRLRSRFSKVRTLLGSPPMLGSKSTSPLLPPVSLASDDARPTEPSQALHTEEQPQSDPPNHEQHEQVQHRPQHREQSVSNSTTLQVDPSPYADGIFRPGDRLGATLTFYLHGSDGRSVVSVKSKFKGVRECQIFIPSDESDPLFRQQEVPKRRTMVSSVVTFWTDHCPMFTKDELSTLRFQREGTSEDCQEPVSARFEFLLPEKLNATWQDDLTADELARPRRMRGNSRMPIDLPPSLDVKMGGVTDTSKEEGNSFLQKAAQWVQGTKSDEQKWAKVEYSIEVVIKRQKMGWAGRLSATKKERLSTALALHPYPPFSKTVPTPAAPVPAVLPLLSVSSDRRRVNRASMIVDSSHRTDFISGEDSVGQQRRRSLQVDAGSLTTPLRETTQNGSATTFAAGDDNLQILTNEMGRQQAWYKHSAVDESGKVYMEISFPALASISTDRRVPFLLRLSLPRGSRPKTNSVRMSLLRSITSTTRFGTVKVEDRVMMQTPSGQSAAAVDALIRRDDQRMDLPHRAGAEVQNFEGSFRIHGYTVPSRSASCSSDWTVSTAQSLGHSPQARAGNAMHRLVDASQRTVPSFAFKNLKLSYTLLLQVDIEAPSPTQSGRFDLGFGQLEIPAICVASECMPGAIGSRRNTLEMSREGNTSPRVQGEFFPNLEAGAAANLRDPSDETGSDNANSERPTYPAQGGLTGQSSGGGRSLSRIRALPTYSSLYLRDMARRAAGRIGSGGGEGSPLDSQGDESSGSSESGLELSADAVADIEMHSTIGQRRSDDMTPRQIGQDALSGIAELQRGKVPASSSRTECYEASRGQPDANTHFSASRCSAPTATVESEVQSSLISDQGPSPPYTDDELRGAPLNRLATTRSQRGSENTRASQQTQQCGFYVQTSTAQDAGEGVLETTTSTELLDLLFESTGETLPPEYPIILRTPSIGSGNGHTMMMQDHTNAAGGAGPSSSSSSPAAGRSVVTSTGSVATAQGRDPRVGTSYFARESNRRA